MDSRCFVCMSPHPLSHRQRDIQLVTSLFNADKYIPIEIDFYLVTQID